MLIKYFSAVVVLFFCFLFFAIEPIKACQCGNMPTVMRSFNQAENVFIGEIIKFGPEEPVNKFNSRLGATFLVKKVYKGSLKVGDTKFFEQGSGDDCQMGFGEKMIGFSRCPRTHDCCSSTYLPIHRQASPVSTAYLCVPSNLKAGCRSSASVNCWQSSRASSPKLSRNGGCLKTCRPSPTWPSKGIRFIAARCAITNAADIRPGSGTFNLEAKKAGC